MHTQRNFVPTRASSVFMQKIALIISKAYMQSRDRFAGDAGHTGPFVNASNPLGIPKYAEHLSEGMKFGIVEWQESIVLLEIGHIALFSNTSLPNRWVLVILPFFPPFVYSSDFSISDEALTAKVTLPCIVSGEMQALPQFSVFSAH